MTSRRYNPCKGRLHGLWFAVPLLVVPTTTVAAESPFELLIVHSYHHGFEWTDTVHEGLLRALQGMNVDSRVEYLDTKRFPDCAHLEATAALLSQKYRALNFDAVAAIDDNAIDFVLKHRSIFGDDTPIVFGGYNAYEPGSMTHLSNVTGVAETVDLEGTLRLAHHLVPSARRVLVVSDATRTSSVVAANLREVAPDIGGGLRFEFLTAQDAAQAGRALADLPSDAIAILLPFTVGAEGRFVDYSESARKLISHAGVPVFSLWDFYLGDGIVGGSLTSGELMGVKIGERLRRVLEGQRADRIPILEVAPTVVQVDYSALVKHGIALRRVPSEADVVGAPSRTIPIDRRILLWSAVGALAALLLVVYLASNVLRRQRAEDELRAHQSKVERALAHETLLAEVASALNATDDFKTVLDDILAKLTEGLAVARISLYSFSEAQAVGAKISSRLSERGMNIKDLDVLSFRRVRGVFEKLRQNERVISDALVDLPPDERDYYRSRNIGAIVILPVQVAHRVRGILGFSQETEYHWDDDELAVFETVAGLIAAAWERYGEMKARLDAEQKHADALQALEKSSRMAAVGVMAAGIAHEINQPLNAIRVTTEASLRRVARSNPPGPDWLATKLRTVSAAVTRIDLIIRHVREFWTDRDRRDLTVLDLETSIRRAFELVGRQARNRGIEVVFEMSAAPVFVLANTVQLEQIVINLVVNSVQAITSGRPVTAEEGRIVVSTSSSAGVAFLEVSDDGPGVSDDDVGRMFEPFFTTKGPTEGTGLGLAIVRNLVESFRGGIDYRRNEMGGATFTVTFPAYESGRGVA